MAHNNGGRLIRIADQKLTADLLAWIESVQLTQQEADLIKESVLEFEPEYQKEWLERMTSRIDRTIARSQYRISQAEALRLQWRTAPTNYKGVRELEG